jgi:hypothetical protein
VGPERRIQIPTVLSDNGREFCGRPDKHPYELFLQLEDIEHWTTKVRRPQSNGFIERFHRTLLDEHLRVKGRTTWYESLDEMQADLDEYLELYNSNCPHGDRKMKGRTPFTVFQGWDPQSPEGRRRQPQPEGGSESRVGLIPGGAGCQILCKPREADLFFRLVSARYEKGSIILTSNKHVRDWPEIFAGDEILTTAILDRLLHHVHIIHIDGRSYRLRELDGLLAQQQDSSPPRKGGETITS